MSVKIITRSFATCLKAYSVRTAGAKSDGILLVLFELNETVVK